MAERQQRLSYKFQRLRERLREAIETGVLSGKLPGERVLARQFRVNAKTLSKALTDLAAEGLLERTIGRGTFVRGQTDEREKTLGKWLILSRPGAQASPLAEPGAWNLVAGGYASQTVPLFEKYAAHALERAQLAPQSYVLDVATGPGTLALLAARKGHRVTALDFAADMIAKLRDRAGGLALEAIEGDGQNLPFADQTFEAGFSMFGLMFFPDRARGFAELRRVLRPGGRALVSSWTPVETVPAMRVMFGAMQGELPNLPFGSGTAPLGDNCIDENNCASAVCLEDENGVFACSDECVYDNDCVARLPICADIAFVGRICVRDPG